MTLKDGKVIDPAELKESIVSRVKALDPNINESDESFKAAMVMIAALTVGQNVRNLKIVTGIDEETIRLFATNLKKSKIWSHGTTYANWGDKANGIVEFWCDVLVAQGLFKRK